MQVITSIKDIRKIIKQWKKESCSIGLVPTMGYLHNGHASLVQESVKNNNKTVVSVFLNPTQFSPNEDLASYPRDFERDCNLLNSLKTDVVFYPNAEEMYGKKPLTKVYVEEMSSKLCGKTRPIHFGGVALVVSKLFNIVTPDKAYFGSKDYQQLQIIKKMVYDLNFDIEIVGMPIVRDSDGLALSSRNIYLNENERFFALSLNKSLDLAEKLVREGEVNVQAITDKIKNFILSYKEVKIDYINIVEPDTLSDIDIIKKEAVILIAAYIGKARLIDNRLLVKV